jgi:hypothetical protein
MQIHAPHEQAGLASARTAITFSCLLLLLSGCVTDRLTQPPRAATEQLLISSAADRAADDLKLSLPVGTKIFLDSANFEGYDSKYALGTIEDRLLRQGMLLMPDRAHADVVVAVRSGALSVDEHKIFFGIPSIAIPVPFSGPVAIPEIAFFEKDRLKGVAKFAATGYGVKDGKWVAGTDPQLGFSSDTHWVVLVLVGWTDKDLVPGRLNDE